MALKQINHGSKEYKQMVDLRLRILREPLGLGFTPEELGRETEDILIANIDEDDILACCILSQLDNDTVRLRQMAVHEKQQKKGLGENILHFSENLARDKGYKTIMMHARDSAIGFYEKLGYKVDGNGFMEVGLPHHYMYKTIRYD